MSADLLLPHSVTGPTSRALLDHLALELGLPVTSELSYPRPEGLGDLVAMPVAAVSRVELGGAGFADARALVLVEHLDTSARVLGDGLDLLADTTDVAVLARGLPGTGRVGGVRRGVREWVERGPSGPSHASNADVEELTRRAHALSWEEWDLARSVIGSRLTVVPVLAASPHHDLVGPGDGVARYLRALRDVEGGVPLEWALRHALERGAR